MSKRELQIDRNQARETRYNEVPLNEVYEAFWEMAEALQSQELDIGPKAAALLKKRADIKKQIS